MVTRNPLLSAKEICMTDLKCGLLKVLAKEQIGCECMGSGVMLTSNLQEKHFQAQKYVTEIAKRI